MIEILVELLITFLIVHSIARTLIHGFKKGKRNELSAIFPIRKEQPRPEIKMNKRDYKIALDKPQKGGYLYRCIGKPVDMDVVEPAGFKEALLRKSKHRKKQMNLLCG